MQVGNSTPLAPKTKIHLYYCIIIKSEMLSAEGNFKGNNQK